MQTVSPYTIAACSHFVFTAFPYENLGERGFYLDQSLDCEENGVVVQTLLVKTPMGNPVCLEFREIIDEEEFLGNLKKQSEAVRGRDVLRPGLRFYGKSPLASTIGMVPVQVVTPDSSLKIKVEHPNTAQTFLGVYLGLSPKDQQAWSQFLGTQPVDGAWLLADGSRLICGQPGDGLYEFMELRKDFPFWAVILKSDSFEHFIKQAEPEKILEWQRQRAALIKEHLTDWDLLVI
jgi:hypothetical protein